MKQEEFQQRQTELLSQVPEEFRGALSQLAWDSGHAYGYHEVLNHLETLVDGLEKPIADYTRRLKG